MKEQQNILFVIGTRPEAIKLAPLIRAFKTDKFFNVQVCLTAQHRELLDVVIDFFEIEVDYDLDLMTNNQSSLGFISKAIVALEKVVEDTKPDILVVQGDTSTVLVGSLVAFYKQVKVAHIEAGLRSYDLKAPFPEEMNRLLTSSLSNYHFAPTQSAVNNLKAERIEQNVHLVGNTVIDALQFATLKLEQEKFNFVDEFKAIDFDKRIILVSCHRRESFGKPLQDICKALNELAIKFSDIQIVMLIHPNPQVLVGIEQNIDSDKIKLIQPLNYPKLVWMMKHSFLIMTDSGGIQEEAPSLGKPVLVLREVTERKEGVEVGTAKLVGMSMTKIIYEATALLTDDNLYSEMSRLINPYGDGQSSKRILSILKQQQ